MAFKDVVSKALATLHEDVINGTIAGVAGEVAFGLPVWANFVVAAVVVVGSSFLKNSTVLSVKDAVDVATEVAQTVDAAVQTQTKLP
ncbi:MAG TPA: hypothetical protein VFT53_07540 [Candidatus Saccharimonadales bacterium]|nr:hypothetical protein [Candidatus Saccharimonadales bacterium]